MRNNGIYESLRKRYPEPEYALLAEVSDAAGFNRSRSADFIAMGIWPSRGLHLIGFEVKASRSDWLRELKDPSKAENIFKFCDYWFLVTVAETDALGYSVAKLEEIPAPWGWLNVDKNGRITVKKEAPKLDPAPLSRNFLAALLKRAVDKTGYILQASIQDKVNEAKARAEENTDRATKALRERYNELAKAVADFETASGVKLSNYTWDKEANGRIGDAVKMIAAGALPEYTEKLKRLETIAKDISAVITHCIATLENAQKPS